MRMRLIWVFPDLTSYRMLEESVVTVLLVTSWGMEFGNEKML